MRFVCALLSPSNAWCQSALANLRAAIVALANSNSGAPGAAAPGSVVLVSNLNEKVMVGEDALGCSLFSLLHTA